MHVQRGAPGWGGALSPFTDFGAVAPTFGRVGGFLRSIEQEMDQMLQVHAAPSAGHMPAPAAVPPLSASP